MIIGIAGKAKAGKDTFATILNRHLPKYERYSFAYPIKDMLAVGLKIPREYLDDPERKEEIDPVYLKAYREIMQTLGTEWGRKLIHPDIWLLAAQARGNHLIIPDVRFENEAAWVRENGILIHITSDRSTTQFTQHESERGIAARDGDFMFRNNGSLDELEEKIVKYIINPMYRGEI